ncbi:unnamed protein product [Clonostachys solani]|uniref:Uncharacterized protein n=1 Tax=Clonostachys solani TaxID=160281 RepID=A0A9N9W765_9HYPO|nr:unnamed protein product [Clonostachys solani]
MNGAQGFIQASGSGSPREGGRGPAFPPPPVGQGPQSRPHSRVDLDSLHMPIPRKTYSPSQWSRGHEDDMSLAVRRERNPRYHPRTASPRRSELRPQYHDAQGSRHALTVLDDLSTIRVVQIEMCRHDEDGSPVQRPWEQAKIFELHVTNDAALRKVEQLEQHTLPVLDKFKEELSSLMQEKLEYARRYLEEKEEDPYSFSHELVQFETNFQKVDRSLRDSREELHEDWSRSDKKRNRSKDRKRQKSKTTSKGHKKPKSDKDRGRSNSSKPKHMIALVSITAYFKRTLLPEEYPQSFRESEASREDDEIRRYRRPAEYHQRDRRSSEGGRDSRHFSDYDDMHSPSQYSSRGGAGQERYPTRDHHDYDARYQSQAGMGQHERPAVNHQQQQYDMHQQHPQNQAHQQPNMGQQQGSGMGQQRPQQQQQQQQHNMHQQPQAVMGQQRPQQQQQQQQQNMHQQPQAGMGQQRPQQQQQQQNMHQQPQAGMGQQRPQQQQQQNMNQQPQAGMGQQRPQQQDQNHISPQGFNHQDHQGLAPANQQRQAPTAPQGHAGMMPQQQPVINQQRQQPQPQPQMPQQRQPAQPGMAPQQQPQQPAAQQKPQGQPIIAQPQQQQQQQPSLNPQKQQAHPGMAQQPQHNQAAKVQQAQPAILHQHGHLPQGQGGHPGGPQNPQQRAQAIPAQVAAQMKDQQAQRAMGKDKGPLPPPPHVPPLHIPHPVSSNKDGKHQGDRKGKASSGKHHTHPGSPRISEESVSDYDGAWSDSASDVSTPATSTSGGSHHKVKKSSRRYSKEHFGIPTRHHVKPGKTFIDEHGFAREASPPSPRRAYTEDQRYARRAPSPSPRRYYEDESRYTYESARSPRPSHRKGPEYVRHISPSPRRGRDDIKKHSRYEDYAPRIIQSVRRMTPDEVGREILDGDQPWRRSGHNRSPLGEDRGKDRAGRPYEKDNFVEKIRRFTEGVLHEPRDRDEGRYERREPRSRHMSSRDYSPSPERPVGRRPTYATRGRD